MHRVTPLGFIKEGFLRVLHSPRRGQYARLYGEVAEQTKTGYCQSLMPKKYEDYLTGKEKYGCALRRILDSQDRGRLAWKNIPTDFMFWTRGPWKEIDTLSQQSPHEREVVQNLHAYLTHEVNHVSPKAIIEESKIGLSNIYTELSAPNLTEEYFPKTSWGSFSEFVRLLDAYTSYFDDIISLGQAFFSTDQELAEFPRLMGLDLPEFLAMHCHAMALRFIGANFAVVSEKEQVPADRNTILWSVGEGLDVLDLPRVLFGVKPVCNIKNAVRTTWLNEANAFPPYEDVRFQDLSLARHLRGQENKKPVAVKIEAIKHTDQVWELRTSDNGHGIIVEKLFGSLVKVAETHPEQIHPELLIAIRQFSHPNPTKRNPFAFNELPYGFFLESAYHLGVSTGGGGLTSGMGLWGSAALAARMGAVIKVGVNPVTGGFYESVFFPMNMSVEHGEIERVANEKIGHYRASDIAA